MNTSSSDYQHYDEKKFAEKIKNLTPNEQEAVRKFWRSLVLRSQRAFSEENGRPGTQTGTVGAVRSCNCCPYGYHIDLDFVRYCESLAHAKPSEEELRRRDRRRSRKSMEFMLGFESLFEQWDADARVQAKLTEAAHESEPDSPRPTAQTQALLLSSLSSHTTPRPRSSSVPRFTYGGLTRSESPFGTGSSTTSSLRGGIDYLPQHASHAHAANSPPETRAFLREALDEVCSDFERTLERTSVRRRKAATSTGAYSISDRNNNTLANGFGSFSTLDKRQGLSTWNRYYDTTDSCVAANKSPRSSRLFSRSNTLPLQQRPTAAEVQYESYVQATVAANAKSPVEHLETAPPPPPRRHHLSTPTVQKLLQSPGSVQSSASALSSPVGSDVSHGVTGGGAGASTEAHALFNIREQMALSLKRMKDLEEQVKTIPEMQSELDMLRAEKQRLQSTLQRKDEELQRARRSSESPSPSPKQPSPVQFTPQRISPVSLESLGARLRTNSTSSERAIKTTLKRDVGTMSVGHTTRDIAVGSPILGTRAVGTNPAQQLKLHESLYTQMELEQKIKTAITTHEEQQKVAQRKKLISVGTQMYVPKRELRESGAQTQAEKPVLKHAVGVLAKPATRESYVSCKPDTRSVGSSEHRIDDVLCEKCKALKHSVACNTDEPAGQAATSSVKTVSLKLLDALPGRSNTFSLGDQEKLNIKCKTIGTQYTPIVVHSAGSQTSRALVHTVGTQFAPEMQTSCTQSQVETRSRQTDTAELTRLRISETKSEQIVAPVVEKPPSKPQTCTTGSNTTPPARTSDACVNTKPQPPPVRTTHSASNTEQVHKRDVACGDVVKPHISIACADNYCDSCKDAIKHLAKDFSKVTVVASAALTRSASSDSRIPRPKHLSSPSPVRKQFKRQNTYTITPSPTPSPVTEKRTLAGSLQEKPPSLSSFQTLESSGEEKSFITEPTFNKSSSPIKSKTTSLLTAKRSPGGSYDLSQLGEDELIVREEKRVSISWSRDASPAPLFSTTSTEDTEKPAERLDVSTESSSSSSATNTTATVDEVSKGVRKKSSTPLKSSQSEESQITVIEREIKKSTNTPDTEAEQAKSDDALERPPTKALLQKIAMSESKPREKAKLSRELQSSLKIINDSLLKKLGAKPFSSASLKTAKQTIQEDWFRISSTNNANPHEVEDYLDHFEALSVPLLEYCVNMVDNNGNTAMHYAVSHGNFDVVSILLDSKVCNVNQMNNAGYTSVMLVSLAKLKNVAHRTVVERLFQMADVNIRAKKHCQTALMLAVSHGNSDMVAMLLAAGADINIQDEDGSTALMCAAEHGRIDIVKHLLSQPDCDSLIQDMDGSTAFKIAWQAGHRDVGLILYVHEQMLRSKMPDGGPPSTSSTTRTPLLSPRHKPTK